MATFVKIHELSILLGAVFNKSLCLSVCSINIIPLHVPGCSEPPLLVQTLEERMTRLKLVGCIIQITHIYLYIHRENCCFVFMLVVFPP